LLVTFLWSTSWILIKVGLGDLDLAPISFAGLRGAALVLAAAGAAVVQVAGSLRRRSARRPGNAGEGLGSDDVLD
jgi:drug/metabolite transporter (DMT)-like permease